MATIPESVGSSGAQQAKYEALKNGIMSELRVATIGTVLSISGNLLTVKPIIAERVVSTDGTVQWVDLPPIPDTPYVGNTPAQGDPVLLIFCDQDISGWIFQGNNAASGAPALQQQQVLQQHSINNAVAICGFNTPNANVVPAPNYGPNTATTTNNGSGVSNALISFIESWEGFAANWYDDGTGTETIGYGHTGSLPSGWTAPLTSGVSGTAGTLLTHDLASYITSVQSIFSGTTLTQNQFDALVDFCYNMGSGNLSSSTLAKDVKAGASSAQLKIDFEAYSSAGSPPKMLQGLLHRRDAEWAMFCNAQYLNNG